MKVCFVTPYSPKTVTGIGTFILGLGRALKKKGVEIAIMAPHATNALEMDNAVSDDELIEIGFIDRSGLKNISLMKLTVLAILKNRKSIDILHLQQALPLSACSAIMGKVCGIRVITTIHLKNPSVDNRLIQFINTISEKMTLRLSDSVTYVSKATYKTLPVENGVVIENGISLEQYVPDQNKKMKMRLQLKSDNSQVLLVFASRWTENKGIYDLLTAYSELNQTSLKNSKLILIGGGEEEQVKDKINELSLTEHVNALGRLETAEEVHAYFLASDIFLLPSYWEGIPFSLLEAMACGLVPIASNVGGNPEVITDGADGLLIQPKDIDGLKERIEWCINNREKLPEMGKRARKKVEERFSIETAAEKYIELYRKVHTGEFR